MKLFLKLTCANILKNKFRTFMITFSVMLSAALIYSIMNIGSVVEESFSNLMKMESGNAEIFVVNNSEPGKGLREDFKNSDLIEYARGTVQTYGYMDSLGGERIRADLQGYSLDDLKAVHGISGFGAIAEAFDGAKAIIGVKTAEKYGLKPGDTIVASINSKDYRLEIWGISPDKANIFTPEAGRIRIVLPTSFLQELTGLRDSFSAYYIKTNDAADIDKTASWLAENYPQYHISTADNNYMKTVRNLITVPMLILVLVVVVISFFIINSAFKVITIERLPFIGTLRSIGSTKRTTGFMLLGESLAYGIAGGVLGSLLGIFVVQMIIIMSPGGSTADVQAKFDLPTALISIGGAIGLALVSALRPVTKTLRISIKDIIANTLHNIEDIKFKRTLAGAACIVTAFLLFIFAPKSIALPAALFGVVLIPVGVALMIPFFIAMFCKVFEWLGGIMAAPHSKLALSNIRHDKTLHSNIVLLGIGLGVILLVNLLVSSVMTEVLNVYNNAHYDIYINRAYDDASFDAGLSRVEGVSTVYKSYEVLSVKVENKNFTIGWLDTLDERYLDEGWDIDLGSDRDKVLSGLRDRRGIIVSATMAKTYDLSAGDRLDLKLGDNVEAYIIVDISPYLINNGQMAFIGSENFLKDIPRNYGINYYIGTQLPADRVKENIADRFSAEELNMSTLKEVEKQNVDNNNSLFILLRGVSLIAMLIGAIGIFNNYVISLISRKRNLSVLRSIGLEKGKMFGMLVSESLLCGFIGSIMGIFTGILFTQALVYICSLISMPAVVHYSLFEIGLILGSGILISLAAAITPAVKTNKMSIVQNLKYE